LTVAAPARGAAPEGGYQSEPVDAAPSDYNGRPRRDCSQLHGGHVVEHSGDGLVTYWRTTGEWGELARPLGADDFECR
jgi:hypothetical protein